ncbi:MAG: hypothetical protein ACRDQE_00190 [Gaiellales bacterium]
MTGSEAPRLRRALGGTNPLSRYPRAYLFLARRRYGSRVLGPDTDIVIEGFPRSANTFAVTAFELAQERPVTVAHHLHVAAHVVRAVQADVPVIVLVRAPEDAIASVVARKPSLDPAAAAAAYLRFYEGVAGVLDACVVAEFRQVVDDFGGVIESTNRAYGTTFTPFEHTDENVRRCFDRIEAQNRDRSAGGRLVESSVARPSDERARQAEAARGRVESLPADVRSRLARVYDTTVERAAP